jgi:2-C-methyl-D-erythritol 4-phosphate cytidylyltransferase
MSAAALIVGGGRGVRFGGESKIFLPLGGRPLISYALDAAQHAVSISSIVVVVGAHTREQGEALIAGGAWTKVRAIVTGGDRRQDSVANGIQALQEGVDAVAIHDAARPFVTSGLFDACLTAALRYGAAIAAVPVTDTIKRAKDDFVDTTIPRDDLWAAQTPQAFQLDRLRAALQLATEREITVTDEATLFEVLGLPVALVAGTPSNLKITHPVDLVVAEAILKSRELAS